MLKGVVVGLVAAAVGAGAAAVVWGALILPSHEASGTVNTVLSVGEGLYICQPLGATVDPICPIDTLAADETIFAANEDLLPGQVEWQKIRVTNVGAEPMDIRFVSRNWIEVSDPSGLCVIVPASVAFRGGASGSVGDIGGQGPGVTILGKVGGIYDNPIDGTLYEGGSNDNHGSLEGTQDLLRRTVSVTTVHIEPGDYEDVLLGIRLPTNTPNECLNVVWQLTTTWGAQLHPIPLP